MGDKTNSQNKDKLRANDNSPQSSGKRRISTFWRLCRYAGGVWPLLASVEVCIVGSALLDLARPWIIGFQLFDLVIRRQDLSRLPFVILLLAGSFVGQQVLDFAADVLQESVKSREIIDQAKGIIMAAMHCSAEEAFERLKLQSQTTNTKLRVVAQDLVNDVSRRTAK